MEYKIKYKEQVQPIEHVDLVFSAVRGLRLVPDGKTVSKIYDLDPITNRPRNLLGAIYLENYEIPELIQGLQRFYDATQKESNGN